MYDTYYYNLYCVLSPDAFLSSRTCTRGRTHARRSHGRLAATAGKQAETIKPLALKILSINNETISIRQNTSGGVRLDGGGRKYQ